MSENIKVNEFQYVRKKIRVIDKKFYVIPDLQAYLVLVRNSRYRVISRI